MKARHITIVLLIFISLAAGAVIWWSTHTYGIGIQCDSVTYIRAARYFLAGKGITEQFNYYTKPLTHYPPFYPFLLSAGGIFGVDPAVTARWLQIALMSANTFLIGWFVYRLTMGSWFATLLAAFLFAGEIEVINMHAWVMSDACFLFLSMLGFLFLSVYLERDKRLFLFWAAVTVSAAFFTRYVGLAVVIAGAGSVLLFSRQERKRKLADTHIFLGITLFPMALCILRNIFLAGDATERPLIFIPPPLAKYVRMRNVVLEWLQLAKSPAQFKPWLFTVFIVLIAGLFYFLVRSNKGGAENIRKYVSLYILAIFIPAYIAFLILSHTFFDSEMPLDNRYMFPVYFSGLVVTITVLYNFQKRIGRMRFLVIPVLVIISFCLAGRTGKSMRDWCGYLRRYGYPGFTEKKWQNSKMVAFLNTFPAQAKIYSNGFDGIYMQTGRLICRIPDRIKYITRKDNPDYPRDINRMAQDMRDGAVLAWFTGQFEWRVLAPHLEELVKTMDLKPIKKFSDGVVYARRN